MRNRYFYVPFQKDLVEEDGTFKGYGSVFGGKPDSYGDLIAQGAFKKSLEEGGRNGSGVAMRDCVLSMILIIRYVSFAMW